MTPREPYEKPTVRTLDLPELQANLSRVVRRVKLETEDARLVIDSLRSRVAALETATDNLEVLLEELRAVVLILDTNEGALKIWDQRAAGPVEGILIPEGDG